MNLLCERIALLVSLVASKELRVHQPIGGVYGRLRRQRISVEDRGLVVTALRSRAGYKTSR